MMNRFGWRCLCVAECTIQLEVERYASDRPRPRALSSFTANEWSLVQPSTAYIGPRGPNLQWIQPSKKNVQHWRLSFNKSFPIWRYGCAKGAFRCFWRVDVYFSVVTNVVEPPIGGTEYEKLLTDSNPVHAYMQTWARGVCFVTVVCVDSLITLAPHVRCITACARRDGKRLLAAARR